MLATVTFFIRQFDKNRSSGNKLALPRTEPGCPLLLPLLGVEGGHLPRRMQHAHLHLACTIVVFAQFHRVGLAVADACVAAEGEGFRFGSHQRRKDTEWVQFWVQSIKKASNTNARGLLALPPGLEPGTL